ncbi:hypothetical protein P389DRAFT_165473 [Cystobasidium minutum MCA 4210]|uniref:uncharacterized protein n=1 Tax=Cystobasidium minutum MCA 4210 TaxID=1397322 RepID=UPI0034CE7401|eukprot:jgi/Rhomi1/165473/fgenesh1_kg.1_\
MESIIACGEPVIALLQTSLAHHDMIHLAMVNHYIWYTLVDYISKPAVIEGRPWNASHYRNIIVNPRRRLKSLMITCRLALLDIADTPTEPMQGDQLAVLANLPCHRSTLRSLRLHFVNKSTDCLSLLTPAFHRLSISELTLRVEATQTSMEIWSLRNFVSSVIRNVRYLDIYAWSGGLPGDLPPAPPMPVLEEYRYEAHASVFTLDEVVKNAPKLAVIKTQGWISGETWKELERSKKACYLEMKALEFVRVAKSATWDGVPSSFPYHHLRRSFLS